MTRFPVVPEPRAVFTDFGQMYRCVEDIERDSETYVLDEPMSELKIYRSNQERTLTQPVFQKICGRLSPGLGRLVLDIAGITPSDDNRMISTEIAIEIFNSVLKLRQNRLTDSSITVNSSTGRVDGFVGSGFRRLSGTDFLTMVEDFVVSPFKFVRGVVHGRSMSLLFGSSVEQHHVSGFSPGFYFANSDSGFSGVKAYKSLVRSSDGSFAIRRNSLARKLSHVGHDIRSRFRAILRREVTEVTDDSIQEIKSLVKKSQLSACRLRPEYPSYFQQTIETIAHRICSFGRGTNYQLIMQALLSKLKQASIETMTAFDVFDALGTEASRRSMQAAEMAAVSAYLALVNADLCFGKEHPMSPKIEEKKSSKLLVPKEIWDTMNSELQSKVVRLHKLLRDDSIDIIRNRHHIGSEIDEIETNAELYGGVAAVKVAVNCFDVDLRKGVLYQAWRFVKAYPTSYDLEQLVSTRNRKGGPLLWTHIISLLRVKEQGARLKLIEEWQSRCWSSRELDQEIDKICPRTTSGEPRGRKPKKPTDLDGFLVDIKKTSKSFRSRLDVWNGDDGLSEVFDERPINEYTSDDREEIVQTIDELQQLQTEIETQISELTKLNLRLVASEEGRTARPVPSKGALVNDDDVAV